MSKRKSPKFNSVLEDFRNFVGESEKVALYEQGKDETKAPSETCDCEVKETLPGGGDTKGGPTDPLSMRGAGATEKVEGQKEPTEEHPERKEIPTSGKIANETLVNRLLANLKVAQEEIEKGDSQKEDAVEKIEKEDEKLNTEKKPENEEVTESKEEKEASEVDLDALASKIASDYRNSSVGYELGRYIFSQLGRKVADEVVPSTAGGEDPNAGAAPGGPAGAGAPDASGGGGELQVILQALQELVQEGQLAPEQAQQIVMELQQAASAGGDAAAGDAAPGPEEVPGKQAGFTPQQVAQIEANINSKVAEWVAEGKTDAQITALVKEAAEFDAKTLSTNNKEASVNEALSRKVAALTELGATKGEIEAYVKQAKADIELNNSIEAMVNSKVAELKTAGKTDAEIEAYLKVAAAEDAKLLKAAAAKEEVKAAITSKIAATRQEKIANMPPEMQQIIQALQELLQTGQITEEEATQVLHELGLTGGGADGGAPGAAPGAAPGGAPEKSEEAPAPKPPTEKKEEPKKKKEEPTKDEE